MPLLNRLAVRFFLAVSFLATLPTAQAVAYIPLSSALSMHGSSGASVTDVAPPPPSPPDEIKRRIQCRRPLHEAYGFQCGLLDVPLDWQNPALGQGRIYYARLPASPDVVRKGTIFIDTGVPLSTSPMWTPQEWLADRGKSVHDLTNGEYDIVVWDARGKGQYNLTIPGPVRCFADATERNTFVRETHTGMLRQPPREPSILPDEPENAREVQHWLSMQSRLVEHCVAKQNVDVLAHMGVASTTRDLLAMADAFDGPGSPVNFWGMSYGTVVGDHLLRTFPERAGRIILDGPIDPEAYAHQPSYDTWKSDVAYTQRSFAQFTRECIRDGPYGCSLVARHGRYGETLGRYLTSSMLLARASLLWQRTVHSVTSHQEDMYKAIAGHEGPNTGPYDTEELILLLNRMSARIDDRLGLGVMPIVCGDKLEEHNTTTAQRRINEIARSLANDRLSAPSLTNDAFPAWHYLCDLWPVRAAELTSGADVSAAFRSGDVRPAHPFIAIHHIDDPLRKHKMWSSGDVLYTDGLYVRTVFQESFGIPLFSHSHCVRDVISDYLRTGRLPAKNTVCRSNDELPPDEDDAEANSDADDVVPTLVGAQDRTEQWRQLMAQLRVGLAAFFVVAFVASQLRYKLMKGRRTDTEAVIVDDNAEAETTQGKAAGDEDAVVEKC